MELELLPRKLAVLQAEGVLDVRGRWGEDALALRRAAGKLQVVLRFQCREGAGQLNGARARVPSIWASAASNARCSHRLSDEVAVLSSAGRSGSPGEAPQSDPRSGKWGKQCMDVSARRKPHYQHVRGGAQQACGAMRTAQAHLLQAETEARDYCGPGRQLP